MLPDVGETGREDPVQRLFKELKAAGYLPKVSGQAGTGGGDDHLVLHTPTLKARAGRVGVSKGRAGRPVARSANGDAGDIETTKRTGTR